MQFIEETPDICADENDMPIIAGFDKIASVPEEQITDKIRRRAASGKQGTILQNLGFGTHNDFLQNRSARQSSCEIGKAKWGKRVFCTVRNNSICRSRRSSGNFHLRILRGAESFGHAGGRVPESTVTIGLEIHKKLRLARRPPPRQLGLEFVETDASQANRSPKRTAGVETPGNLMDAVPRQTRIASHGREMHEVRHLDRTAPVGEGNDPSVSAAHSHVATGVGGTVSAIRTPVPRVNNVDRRIIAVKRWRCVAQRGGHETVDEFRLPIDNFAEAQCLSHAVSMDDGRLDHGISLVALDLLEII